jgi:branched-chain amino acid transport system permease protein
MLAAVAAAAYVAGNQYVRFVAAYIMAWSLAVWGTQLLLRYGLVNFGIGAAYAIGAYSAGLLYRHFGVTDLTIHMLAAVAAGGLWGLLSGLVSTRVRGVQYALLNLALSMVLYGMLLKFYWATGGSDGLYVPAPRLFGTPLGDLGLYLLALLLAAAWTALGLVYAKSAAAHLADGIRINELRASALGTHVGRQIAAASALASVSAGLGGLGVAYVTSHVSPQYAHWSTSGELVVAALISSFLPQPWGFVAGAAVYQAVRLLSLQFTTPELFVGVTLLATLGLWRYFRR